MRMVGGVARRSGGGIAVEWGCRSGCARDSGLAEPGMRRTQKSKVGPGPRFERWAQVSEYLGLWRRGDRFGISGPAEEFLPFPRLERDTESMKELHRIGT